MQFFAVRVKSADGHRSWGEGGSSGEGRAGSITVSRGRDNKWGWWD